MHFHRAFFDGLLLAHLSVPASCLAAVIRVPEDAPSVLAGVDQAVAGDSVLVGPGTWSDEDTRIVIIDGLPENITACAFPRGGISLIGVSGAEETIIGSNTPGFGIMITNQIGEGDILIEGLAFNTVAPPATVVEADKVAFRSCRFVENTSALVGRNFDLEMTNCDVSQNQLQDDLPGLIFVFESRAFLESCRFRNNIGRCVQIDSEFVGAPVPHIQAKNCEFTENRWKSAISLDLYYANIVVSGNLFLRNVAEESYCAGLRAVGCFGTVEFNVFAYDSSLAPGSFGGGMVWEGSNGHVKNNTFVGCHSPHNGAAFVSFDGSWLGFESNIVTHSSGAEAIQDYGSIVYGYPCNLFWANAEGDFGDWTSSPTDLFADPYYCDLDELDFTVRDDSPSIAGGCGQIGALGVGCKGVSIEPMSWGKIKGLYRLDR
jgi:hypothetical protein